MAEYKRIPYEAVEHTEIAHICYMDYEQRKDAPDDAEIEAGWIQLRNELYHGLQQLTDRRREVLIAIVVSGLNETETAKRLGLNQSTVSRHLEAAKKKLRKIMTNTL